jgi:hypothetical protein
LTTQNSNSATVSPELSAIPTTSNPPDVGLPASTAELVAGDTISSSSSDQSHESSPTSAEGTTEDESPLEDGKFLSFEDWKRENLKRVGQSEHIGRGHGHGIDEREIKRRSSIVQDSLDSLGDDAEIDLDFTGFVSDNLDAPAAAGQPPSSRGVTEPSYDGVLDGSRAPRAGVRSKDAGTTCKERFNYASFDCAANILKTNPEAKGASAVLGTNKDSYMLNECSAQNQFLILELCDDISIDTIVLANFEFFSSTFRTFRVSVSDKYPVKIDKWKPLGTFEARNSRDVQAFLVDNPVIWARYLRIEFLTHYGNEYFCPVSLIRVHGTTMLEDYKHDLQSLYTEDDETETQEEGSAEDGLVPDAVAEVLLEKSEVVESEPSAQTIENATTTTQEWTAAQSDSSSGTEDVLDDSVAAVMPTSPATHSVIFDDPNVQHPDLDVCETVAEVTSPQTEAPPTQSRTQPPAVEAETSPPPGPTHTVVASPSNATALTESLQDSAATTSTGSQNRTTRADAEQTSTVTKVSSGSTVVNGTRSSASSTQAPAAAPTMQESFFKSVQKRLQMLESNSSLSLQYIEEQSRALRDAFQKVEQRQLAKTTSFLDYLNTTVLNELRDFRQQYDQLWQSTVIELEMQRERYQQETLAINARLGVLADEVIFQKRMSILQMILILICLGLVIFTRGSLNGYLEMPLVQSVLARSPSSRWLNLSGLDTPSRSPPVTRANSTGNSRTRQGILKSHRRMPSDESAAEATSPSDLLYTPPSPVSMGQASDVDEGDGFGDPQYDPSLIERPSTSPPMLPGTETAPSTPRAIVEPENGSIDHRMPVPGSRPSDPETGPRPPPPTVVVEDATPPPAKHLTWRLPDS